MRAYSCMRADCVYGGGDDGDDGGRGYFMLLEYNLII